MLLDEVDKELERRGPAFVRYADDRNVDVWSQAAGARVRAALRRQAAAARHEAKSAVAPAAQRKFLGFAFWVAKGRVVKRRVAAAALAHGQDRGRELTRRAAGRSLAAVCDDLGAYLAGWKAYLRIAATPGVMIDIDKWVRHRLRALQLKHWKRGRTICRELRARGQA